MPARRVFCAIATILCFLSLNATCVRAQGDVAFPEWLHVGDVTGPGWTAIYFFDAIHGVTAIGGTLLYLEPSGLTAGHWYNSNMPPGITSIRQIRFIQGKLYAASQGTDALVSSDSGRSWQFSGLGLVNANDVYADGSGNLRMLQDPMKVFARLDTLHCIAQGTANIFVSSDGGLNWVSSGVPMIDAVCVGAFADRCQNVYVCPNSFGTAWRSTDFGQNWETVITGSGAGPDLLDGASTVVYITDLLGLFRSTDDGLNWKSVITVTGGPHIMYVWGPMGEHVAISWLGNAAAQSIGIWMTTTGGLDDLHSAPSMTDSNGMPLMQQDTFNVPLELASTCQPFAIPVTIESDVDSMIARLRIGKDSLGDFTLAGTDTTIALRRGHEDTVWLFYQPHHPVDNVLLTFENHWHCSDWTETRTVHVDAIPKAVITSPLLFFAGCLPDTEEALIHLDSCQTLCVDSVIVPSSIAGGFQLITSLPDTASVGVRDSILFRLTSSDTFNSLSDSITVYAHYLGLDSILDDYFYFPHAWGDDTDFSLFSATIPIGFEYPVSWELTLSPPEDSANAGGTVTYQIIQHGTLPPDDTSVDMELVFYDDLLTLNTVDEAWTSISGHYRSADGQAHDHLHFSMPVGDSILATIHLTAYQARVLTTALSIDSVQFSSNRSRPSDCIASAVLTSSEFTIRTSCGGPLLSEALIGLLTIDGISPNPTTGEISLRYTLRGAPVNGTIELEDALGRTVLEQNAPLLPGPNQAIVLDLSGLPSGFYALQLPGAGVASTKEFIKE